MCDFGWLVIGWGVIFVGVDFFFGGMMEDFMFGDGGGGGVDLMDGVGVIVNNRFLVVVKE